jgi:hypothetical protein
MDIHFELFAPTLSEHPFFALYQDINPAAVRRICHTAVRESFLAKGDVLFVEGEEPHDPQMWFVRTGALEYKANGGQTCRMVLPCDNKTDHTFDPPITWVCEPVLWCQWVHHGALCAKSDSRVMAIKAAGFQKIATQCLSDNFAIGDYADAFVRNLNEDHFGNGQPLLDIDQSSIALATTASVYNERWGSRAAKAGGTGIVASLRKLSFNSVPRSSKLSARSGSGSSLVR